MRYAADSGFKPEGTPLNQPVPGDFYLSFYRSYSTAMSLGEEWCDQLKQAVRDFSGVPGGAR